MMMAGLLFEYHCPPPPAALGIVKIPEITYDQVAGYYQYLFGFALVQQYRAIRSQVNGCNICRMEESEVCGIHY